MERAHTAKWSTISRPFWGRDVVMSRDFVGANGLFGTFFTSLGKYVARLCGPVTLLLFVLLRKRSQWLAAMWKVAANQVDCIRYPYSHTKIWISHAVLNAEMIGVKITRRKPSWYVRRKKWNCDQEVYGFVCEKLRFKSAKAQSIAAHDRRTKVKSHRSINGSGVKMALTNCVQYLFINRCLIDS